MYQGEIILNGEHFDITFCYDQRSIFRCYQITFSQIVCQSIPFVFPFSLSVFSFDSHVVSLLFTFLWAFVFSYLSPSISLIPISWKAAVSNFWSKWKNAVMTDLKGSISSWTRLWAQRTPWVIHIEVQTWAPRDNSVLSHRPKWRRFIHERRVWEGWGSKDREILFYFGAPGWYSSPKRSSDGDRRGKVVVDWLPIGYSIYHVSR